jgi:hypothetical protein
VDRDPHQEVAVGGAMYTIVVQRDLDRCTGHGHACGTHEERREEGYG